MSDSKSLRYTFYDIVSTKMIIILIFTVDTRLNLTINTMTGVL